MMVGRERICRAWSGGGASRRAIAASLAMLVAIGAAMTLVLGGCGEKPASDLEPQVAEEAAERLGAWLEENVTHGGAAREDFLSAMDNLYDWPEIGLVGYDGSGYPDYPALTEEYVRLSWQGADGFHKATDLARLILGVSAAGGDARRVAGHDLLAALCNHSRFEAQGANSAIAGLLALDCKGYPVPTGAVWTREKMIQLALKYRNPDGSFSLDDESAGDVDVTAMAVQALWRYADDTEVDLCLDGAVSWLAGERQEDGGYASMGIANSESAAQVVIAMACLGVDVTSDARFDGGEGDPLSFLLAHQQADGGFRHTLEGESDKIASEQAMLALAAWTRLKDGRPALYECAW